MASIPLLTLTGVGVLVLLAKRPIHSRGVGSEMYGSGEHVLRLVYLSLGQRMVTQFLWHQLCIHLCCCTSMECRWWF